MEPLTPPDCDLRDFAFMPLDTIRLLDSDLYALATGEEFRAALTLWCKAWQQVPAASLPNDDRVLAHLSGAGPRWKKIKDMALRGFILCSDGRLYHPVVAEKAVSSWAKRQSYRERSKKGNGKRWGSQKDDHSESLSDPSGTTQGVLEPPKGEGEGEREYSVPNGTGVEPPPADADRLFWTNAKAYLKPFVKGDPGQMIGKWARDYGKTETAKLITAAQIERPVGPIAYIEAGLRKSLNSGAYNGLATPC